MLVLKWHVLYSVVFAILEWRGSAYVSGEINSDDEKLLMAFQNALEKQTRVDVVKDIQVNSCEDGSCMLETDDNSTVDDTCTEVCSGNTDVQYCINECTKCANDCIEETSFHDCMVDCTGFNPD